MAVVCNNSYDTMSQESIVACHTDTESLCVVGFFRFKRLRDAATRPLTIRVCISRQFTHE